MTQWLGRRPPAEAEAEYYARLRIGQQPVTRNEVCMKVGMLQKTALVGKSKREMK